MRAHQFLQHIPISIDDGNKESDIEANEDTDEDTDEGTSLTILIILLYFFTNRRTF